MILNYPRPHNVYYSVIYYPDKMQPHILENQKTLEDNDNGHHTIKIGHYWFVKMRGTEIQAFRSMAINLCLIIIESWNEEFWLLPPIFFKASKPCLTAIMSKNGIVPSSNLNKKKEINTVHVQKSFKIDFHPCIIQNYLIISIFKHVLSFSIV